MWVVEGVLWVERGAVGRGGCAVWVVEGVLWVVEGVLWVVEGVLWVERGAVGRGGCAVGWLRTFKYHGTIWHTSVVPKLASPNVACSEVSPPLDKRVYDAVRGKKCLLGLFGVTGTSSEQVFWTV